MDHWYCAHFTAPWGHNINAIDIMIPCPNPKLSQNWTIDIMTSWVIDIVPMLLSQGVTISMPLILWPHVPIRNLAKNWTIDIMTPWTVDIVTCGRGHKINIDTTASLAMILCTCWYCGTLPSDARFIACRLADELLTPDSGNRLSAQNGQAKAFHHILNGGVRFFELRAAINHTTHTHSYKKAIWLSANDHIDSLRLAKTVNIRGPQRWWVFNG